ncbi:lipid droplet assembly factor 1-like [Etheostoma cragini]|uniref:lipid droplet assembly factor 1-like n=1 Tax=Etheostoma cragini TaxID=417921 RepID=UPI00155EC49F|nr:lipid droplet assembly factor 1-like [Etheostoma cragini]
MEMQQSSSSSSSSSCSLTDFQQQWGSCTTLLKRFYDDPKVAQLMSTRLGQYLSSHPFFALTVLLFGSLAALPVGLFLSFALVTSIMSAVGFVLFEVFLLSVGGLSLLCLLPGIGLFAVMVSGIFIVLYITVSNILNRYFPHLTKQGKVQEKSECQTS